MGLSTIFSGMMGSWFIMYWAMKAPRGMCGSALIDLLAWLLEKELMAGNGNIIETTDQVLIRLGSQGKEMVIVPADKSQQGIPVVLSQEDVRSLQLAKSAIRAAIEILLKESGTRAWRI